jgi:hypothetical protein
MPLFTSKFFLLTGLTLSLVLGCSEERSYDTEVKKNAITNDQDSRKKVADDKPSTDESVAIPGNVSGGYVSCQWSADILEPNSSFCRLSDDKGEKINVTTTELGWGVFNPDGQMLESVEVNPLTVDSTWHVHLKFTRDAKQQSPDAYIHALWNGEPIEDSRFKITIADVVADNSLNCAEDQVNAGGQCVTDTREISYNSDGTIFENFSISQESATETTDTTSISSAKPGETITISFDWTIPERPTDQYCPTCIVYYAYGFIKQDPETEDVQTYKMGCISAGTRTPGQSATVTEQFTIPEGDTGKGVYTFKRPNTGLVYACADVGLSPDKTQDDFGILVVD